jgi:hypothetical protein
MAEHALTAEHEADQLALFDTVAAGYQRAEAGAGGAVERVYRIAGSTVRCCFAGPALVPVIDPAIAHLQTEAAGPADFEIFLFDSHSTDTALPLLAASLVELLRFRWWEHLDNRREIKGFHGGRFKAVFHLGPDILSLLDSQTRTAYYWVEAADQVPYYEKGYPLTTLLNWWLGLTGRFFMHAAAFGTPAGGVLLPGKGGSGKSTTTLACIDSELQIVGDDYCVIDSQSPPLAYSLYNTAKLKAESDLQRFRDFRPLVSNIDQLETEKALLFLHTHFPGKMLSEMPIRAILIPEISGRPETHIRPARAADGLKALAPSTMFQLAGNGQPALQTMANLVRSTPCFTIELGTEIAAIPGVIREFLRDTFEGQGSGV